MPATLQLCGGIGERPAPRLSNAVMRYWSASPSSWNVQASAGSLSPAMSRTSGPLPRWSTYSSTSPAAIGPVVLLVLVVVVDMVAPQAVTGLVDSMNDRATATCSAGWVRCGTWPAPANVWRVTSAVAASASTIAGSHEGLAAPSVSRTGAAISASRGGSPQCGSSTTSMIIGALATIVWRISRGSSCHDARPEGHLFDELLGGGLGVAAADSCGNRLQRDDDWNELNGQRRAGRGDADEWWLVGGHGAHEIRPSGGHPEGDRSAVGVADEVDRPQIERLDQGDDVVLVDAPRYGGGAALAARVAAPVVGDDVVGLGQIVDHERPAEVVGPAAVHEHDGLAIAPALVVEVEPVDATTRHRCAFLCGRPIGGIT